ncbi:MAG: DUF169 domain-containing protein [Acidobacteria bacterium]|nr:DUF169 domain-containing protein [Acidobacteriota bacterium]
MDRRYIAEKLTAQLQLETPPVALAFVESPPLGVDLFEDQVPSACTLWRRAEARVFYAPAEIHYNCPIGVMTMGFEMTEAVKEQLMGVMGKMCGCGYVVEAEAAKIPAVSKKKSGIVYGSLLDLPLEPDLVLMWVTPRQAMFFGEAVGASRWTDSGTAVYGRPACAALAVAAESSRPASSFGCMGMRTYTEIEDDRLFVAVPAARLEELVDSLTATLAANAEMREYYVAHKAEFPA